jgi:peptide/nickel transport system permease protein
MVAQISRMTRASILGAMASDYVEMAHLKGLGVGRIVLWHALPNALAPIITVILLNLAYVIVSAVIVEAVFSYPGLGQLLVDSVATRDVPVVQCVSLIFASSYIVVNIAADIFSTLSNPRMLHPRGS